MLISELIKKLNYYIDCNCDCEVVLAQHNGTSLTTDVELLNCFTKKDPINEISGRIVTMFFTGDALAPKSVSHKDKNPEEAVSCYITGLQTKEREDL